MRETLPCEKCLAKMITWNKQTALTTDPPQYELEFRCACGHRVPHGYTRSNSNDMAFYAEWKKYNHSFKDILRAEAEKKEGA